MGVLGAVASVDRAGGGWLLELPELFELPVDIDDELAPFVTRMVALQHPFTWSQLLAIRGSLEPTNIRALLESMRDNDILVVAGESVGTDG